jgi:hypothetical protein
MGRAGYVKGSHGNVKERDRNQKAFDEI